MEFFNTHAWLQQVTNPPDATSLQCPQFVLSKTEGDSMFRLLFPIGVGSVVLVSLLLIFSPLVGGQTKGDVYLGYSFVSSGLTVGSCCFSGSGSASAGRASLNGWEASASVRLFHGREAVGEVGGGYGRVPVFFPSILGSEKLNVNTSLHTYLFGPRASVSVGRLRPFGQALFGLAHQSVSANAFITNVGQRDNAFALDLGGGIDFRLAAEWLGAFRRTTCKPRSSTPPNTIRA